MGKKFNNRKIIVIRTKRILMKICYLLLYFFAVNNSLYL